MLESNVQPAQAPDTLLSVRHLVKEYAVGNGLVGRSKGRVSAVADVSLDVVRGTSYGIVGESGCGKSTLSRMIVGLEVPTAGSIMFDGADTTHLRGASRRRFWRDVQMVFQDPRSSLDPRMTVGGTLREPLTLQHLVSRGERPRRVGELLSEVGLSPVSAPRYPHEFSGGQLQRVGIARAVAMEPRLIVADEPVSGLDVSVRAHILNLMRELQQSRDITYIVISHDLAVVRYIADTVGVMYLGKLVESGPVDAVYNTPAHPYTAALISAIPLPDPRREQRKSAKPAISGELPSATDPPSGCRFRTRCPLATDMCAEVEPPMRRVATGQDVACHYPLVSPTAPVASAQAGPA
jgi:peptide/nickel transport system ATP-binding protein